MTENPLVSIIVRTKDRPKLLKRALLSIASQTYRPIEVVLVNDGGCDLDIEEINGLLGDVALNYIKLEQNTGRAHAGNVGIENAKGEYIGFLDDDDVFYPEHVSVLVNLLEKYDYKVAYTDANIVFVKYSPESETFVTADKRIFTSKDFSYGELILDNYIPLICLLFSKDVFAKIRSFDEEFELYEDWDLLIRIAESFSFCHIAEVTAEYVQWSDMLQISQTVEFADKAREAHRRIISKHRGKFTDDIIRGLVQNRRELREGELALRNIETTLREREGNIADLGVAKANLERTLHERENALERIYSSHGWKFLLLYYKVRDRILPHNTKRRVLVKAVIKAVSNPSRIREILNIMNLRKFFYYLKNADPSVLEYKLNKKLSADPASNSDSPASPYGAGTVEMPLETNSILLIGNFPSNSKDGGILSDRIESLMKSLRELNYDIALLDPGSDVEEYLKTHGGRFSFVVGVGPEYCYNYFPFVRAYAPHSALIYHTMSLRDDFFRTELLNAMISDGIIVDEEDKKQILLKKDMALHIEVIPDTPDMKNDIGRFLSNIRQRERSGETRHKEELVEAKREESVRGEENGDVRSENPAAKSVLVVGIYLADQNNTVEQIVDRMNRSRRYHVVQKWIALRGDAPSENVKAVTAMKIDSAAPKFQLLNRILSNEILNDYEYVVISDDDIILPDNFLDDFLFLQEKYNFAAAQPARTHNSYIDHFLVERLDGLKARRTRFVEIGPLVSFRRDMLPLILPLDEMTPMGWGFDFVLPCIAEQHGLSIGIIDATPVDHSIRKPMRNYEYDDAKKAMELYLSKNSHLSRDEAFRILEAYV